MDPEERYNGQRIKRIQYCEANRWRAIGATCCKHTRICTTDLSRSQRAVHSSLSGIVMEKGLGRGEGWHSAIIQQAPNYPLTGWCTLNTTCSKHIQYSANKFETLQRGMMALEREMGHRYMTNRKRQSTPRWFLESITWSWR